MGGQSLGYKVPILSVFQKARPLFSTVYSRAGVGAANQGTASNNLALRRAYRLDVGKSKKLGARGSWSVAKRGSKSFRKYQNGRSAFREIGFYLLGRRYTQTKIFQKKKKKNNILSLLFLK